MKRLPTTLLLTALVSLGTLTACSSSDTPTPTATSSSAPASTPVGTEPPVAPPSGSDATAVAAKLVGEWTSTNDSGERLVMEFHVDGTCKDTAPDYEDPTYGSYENCTYAVDPDLTLVIKYIGDDGEPTMEMYKWVEAGLGMQWYLDGDTLRWAAFVYTRTG